ncbi:MAG: putative sulfite oxidase cytochrome subunit [Nitrospira sp.]|nr:putative sulfite oxidase cytochrome subunit [Nitrospira sp.]
MEGYKTSTHRRILLGVGMMALAFGSAWPVWSADNETGAYGVGKPATEAEIKAWNIDVSSTGEGLPTGQGTVKEGVRLFAARCAACHGATGKEGPKDRLVGGRDTLTTAKPVRTIGSYWPYATTLYDYINRAMPFDAPQSLSPDEVYSVIAWLLFENQIIAEDAVMDAQTLPKVQMPNRNGFIQDPRPDVRQPAGPGAHGGERCLAEQCG